MRSWHRRLTPTAHVITPHPLSDRAINKESRSHWNCGTLQESWHAVVDDGTYGTAQRIERLMAEMMAFSELVIIEESMPTPQITVVSASSPISHST